MVALRIHDAALRAALTRTEAERDLALALLAEEYDHKDERVAALEEALRDVLATATGLDDFVVARKRARAVLGAAPKPRTPNPRRASATSRTEEK
jgi:hypothetical protein